MIQACELETSERFTLQEANIARENGWLGRLSRFLLGWPSFMGKLLVLGCFREVYLKGF